MKIKKIEIKNSQINFADEIKKIVYKQNDHFTEKQFEEFREALLKLPKDKIEEISKEKIEIENIKTEEEKISFGEKMKHKLIKFGASVVEHWTAIGTFEIMKHIYQNPPNIF